jgi:hypothetical protein
MQGFIEDMESAGPHHPAKFSDFKQILEESKRHPKQDYFILKAIIVNNLFGVDIMEEAVEICKLRLFLKLVAQVESQDRIEPLTRHRLQHSRWQYAGWLCTVRGCEEGRHVEVRLWRCHEPH